MLTQPPAVTRRAVSIGLILIPINCYWIIQIEDIWYTGQPTAATLFFNAVFSLFVLILINLLLQRFIPSKMLNQRELLTVYAMLCVASSIAGHHFIPLLVQFIPHAFWFATPENEWAQIIHPYVPTWNSVSDKKVLQGYYEGHSTFYTNDNLSAWLMPIFWWSLFILALLAVMVCLCIIVQKQWTGQEKLAYPIIQLPLAVTSKGLGLLKAKLLWVGFAIAAMIDILNGLHFFFPAVPHLNVKLTEIGHLFTDKPWNAIGWTAISFYPFIIGMSFFLPLDLSFSIWFFFLFRKMIQILITATILFMLILYGEAGLSLLMSRQPVRGWVLLSSPCGSLGSILQRFFSRPSIPKRIWTGLREGNIDGHSGEP